MSLATLVQSLTEYGGEVEGDYLTALGTVVLPEQYAIVLAAIRECRSSLATFYDRVEQDLLAHMGEKSMNVEGLGLVEAKKKTIYRKWDNDSLWRLVTAYALDERKLDETTGEYEDAAQAVARVLGECARPSWRLTPLRARGIDPTEYAEVEEDGWQIKLPARQL